MILMMMMMITFIIILLLIFLNTAVVIIIIIIIIIIFIISISVSIIVIIIQSSSLIIINHNHHRHYLFILVDNVIGQYWKFQSEGHSAVSAIEAIVYAAISVSHYLRLYRNHQQQQYQYQYQQQKQLSGQQLSGEQLSGQHHLPHHHPDDHNFSLISTVVTDDDYDSYEQQYYSPLLILFYLQKYRVLSRIHSGGKIPRAIQCHGDGLGSWKSLTDAIHDD
jgi:hypothetical protein